MAEIIKNLKASGILGRSGSAFPVGQKWQLVKEEKANKKYIVCNAASGEPYVLKDEYILDNYAQEVIKGIEIALETINNSSAYIYLRKDFYQKFKNKLLGLTKNLPVKLIKKPGGYLSGEETSLCQAIEGKRPEPRLKPPFPTEKGLFNCPTLINNVETFYYVAKIAAGKYDQTRFYTVNGQAKHKGVYCLPLDWTIEKVMKETGNWPAFDFFVQVGGGASGEIMVKQELKKNKVSGPGAIIIYNKEKINPFKLMVKWADFFMKENCDKCVPCREGVYQIKQIVKKGQLNKKKLNDLDFILRQTSFCGLGKIASKPFMGLINKVIK